MINKNTGEEEKLLEIKGSKCHFRKEIRFGDYDIHLRLDWSDIRDGEPILDADIYSKITGKKLRNGEWHHTEKELDSNTGQMSYKFKFKNLILRLATKTTVAKDMKCVIHFKK